MEQMDLCFDSSIDPVRFRAWKEFDRLNPHIADEFKRETVEQYALGVRRSSARLTWEKMRYERMILTRGADKYKLQNNHCPYYSRLVMALNPRFDGMFVLKDKTFDATIEMIVEAHGETPRDFIPESKTGRAVHLRLTLNEVQTVVSALRSQIAAGAKDKQEIEKVISAISVQWSKPTR